MPLRSRASKAWATDKQVERNMIVCNKFSSFGACCAICSKEALQHIIRQMLHQQSVQGLKHGCAKGEPCPSGEKEGGQVELVQLS